MSQISPTFTISRTSFTENSFTFRISSGILVRRRFAREPIA